MTSISTMDARCPDCASDLRIEITNEGISIGDSEDIVTINCPNCDVELEVELLAAFEIRRSL